MGTPKTIIITALPKSLGIKSGSDRLTSIPFEVSRNGRMTSILTTNARSIGSSTGPQFITPGSYLKPVNIDIEAMSTTDSVHTMSPRKRRLENLSLEEKLLRKKLKNRMAAQSSRDRKKAKMDELEAVVKELEDKNESLSLECERLRTKNKELLKENGELKCKLAERIPMAVKQEPGVETVSSSVEARVSCEPIGPAVFIHDPLLKGQGSQLALALTVNFLCWAWILTGMSTYAILNYLPKVFSKMQNLKPSKRMQISLPLNTQMTRMVWWGPQQNTWNPAKN